MKYSKAVKADLIVISTHGLSGWKLIVFWSVADRVVKLAGCPVFTGRMHHQETDPQSPDNYICLTGLTNYFGVDYQAMIRSIINIREKIILDEYCSFSIGHFHHFF